MYPDKTSQNDIMRKGAEGEMIVDFLHYDDIDRHFFLSIDCQYKRSYLAL